VNDLVPKSLHAEMERRKLDAAKTGHAWTPWEYQQRGLRLMLENAQCGLLADPGTGKTSVTLAAIKLLLQKRLTKRVLIVAPLRPVYEVWPQEISDWTDFSDLGIAILHDAGKERVLRQLQPEHQIALINPEGFPWLAGSAKHMKALGADMLVIDECFAAGTLVNTPNGFVPIESLHTGDYILNEMGRCIINRCTSRPPRGGLVEVKFSGLAKTIRCTEDHPFFTELGWLPAKCLAGRRTLCLDTLRNLRQEDKTINQVVGQGWRKDLLAVLRAEMGAYKESKFERANEQKSACASEETMEDQGSKCARTSGKTTHDCSEGALATCYGKMCSLWWQVRSTYKSIVNGSFTHLFKDLWFDACLADGRRYTQSARFCNLHKDVYWCTSVEQRDAVAAGLQRQSIKMGKGQWPCLEGARWEWERTFARGDSGFRVSAKEVYLQLRDRVGQPAAWLSYKLQSRFWRPEEKDSTRSGWHQPYSTKNSGRKEGGEVEGTWVESVSYLEPGSISLVYNLEVESCPHFEVEGCAIVHNSSRWKNSQAVRFKALRKVIASFKRRYILTGSPRPRSYMDLFGQIYILDRGATLGCYVSHYRNQFFFPTGFQMREWELLPGADKQIDKLVAPMVLRVDAEDYLKMPGKPDRMHRVVLPEKARKEYDAIESTSMSTLFNAPMVSAGAARSKLCQLANGAVYLDAMASQDVRFPSTIKRPVKTLHTVKAEALADLVEELQGEPILVSIGYHHDVAAIRAVLGAATPCLNSEVTRVKSAAIIEAWNKGLLPVLLGHPASMGHGLNLQKCNCRHVAYYDVPDDYDLYDQFFRRVWRQGNKATFVFRHHFVAADTVDVAKMANLKRKGTGQNAFLQAMKEYAEARYGKNFAGLKRSR
jgi:hypothetical protein